MVDFDFDELFDENTVRIKKENVDVKFIMKKREENLRAKEERMREKAELERLEKLKETENKSEENGKGGDDEPPKKITKIEEVTKMEETRNGADSPKLSKRREGKRGQNKKRGQHFEAKMEDKVTHIK